MELEQIKVVLVEDHILVRQGTKALIQGDPSIRVVGETDSAEEAVRLVEELAPDVVVLDIRLRVGTGIDVARALQRRRSLARVLVVTAYDYEQYVTALTRAGVSGYVMKDVTASDLIKAIHQVYRGEGVLIGAVAATVLRNASRSQQRTYRPAENLSAREIEVLELVAEGYRNHVIAKRLEISVRTVEAHVASILGKLGATSRGEAIKIAIRRGMLKSNKP